MLVAELKEIATDVYFYFTKCFHFVKPLWVLSWSVVSYVLFPDATYIPASIALIGALLFDILTKYFAISVKNGGLVNSIRIGKIRSESFWLGTRKKIIGVLTVMILCGLSYRLTSFTAIPLLVQSLCFTILFLREAQSAVENLMEAGFDNLGWLLNFMKKKEKQIMDNEILDNKKDDNTLQP